MSPRRKFGPAGNPDLTAAERDVQRLIGHGLANKNIAFELDLTESTVKAHLASINRKLGLTNRVQIALEWHCVNWRRPAAETE